MTIVCLLALAADAALVSAFTADGVLLTPQLLFRIGSGLLALGMIMERFNER